MFLNIVKAKKPQLVFLFADVEQLIELMHGKVVSNNIERIHYGPNMFTFDISRIHNHKNKLRCLRFCRNFFQNNFLCVKSTVSYYISFRFLNPRNQCVSSLFCNRKFVRSDNCFKTDISSNVGLHSIRTIG